MRRPHQRRVAAVAFVGAAVSSPLVLATLAILTGPFNALVVAFAATINVENDTTSELLVTPLGAVDASRARFPLPLYQGETRLLPRFRRAQLKVQPNGTLSLTYDTDDVNLAGFVVDTQDGRRKVLRVANDRSGCCYGPPSDRFVLTDLLLLPEPTPEESRVADDLYNHRLWVIAAMSPVPLILLMTGIVLMRRSRRAA